MEFFHSLIFIYVRNIARQLVAAVSWTKILISLSSHKASTLSLQAWKYAGQSVYQRHLMVTVGLEHAWMKLDQTVSPWNRMPLDVLMSLTSVLRYTDDLELADLLPNANKVAGE